MSLKSCRQVNKKLDICGFAVSCVENSSKYWMGYPIRTVKEYLEEGGEYVFILATTNGDFQAEMKDELHREGIYDYIEL